MNQKIDEKMFNKLREKRAFDGGLLKEFAERWGERFWRALKAIVDGQLKKYIFQPSGREAWVVVGKKRDYMIVADFYCNCEDFYLNVVIRKKTKYCYHILSKIIGEALGLFEIIKVEDEKYDMLMNEWKTIEE
ncbi:MAG: hypothetical protein ACTSQY_04855 [Candidatus Odinarchaeia archaeon]